MTPEQDDERYDRHLLVETNRALERGALLALGLAAFACVSLPISMWTGLASGLWGPWGFAGIAFVACAMIWGLARRKGVRGARGYAVLLAFVSMPTIFYATMHLTLPGGAATFLNGPLTYLYFVLIAVSGMMFDRRLSTAAGIVAAAGYLGCVALSWDALAAFSHPDPLTEQDMTKPVIYAFRAVMMVVCGSVVGYLAIVGRRLTQRVVKETAQRQAVDRLFGEYVSNEVKDKLLADPLTQQGERREVVVLFSDIRDFTTLSEQSDPEDLVQRLNEYFDAMLEPIAEEGGVVDKFVGDAIMAVFGGVIELDDPCAAAVRAARGMRVRLTELNAAWEKRGIVPFRAGIGLHLGEVVQGVDREPQPEGLHRDRGRGEHRVTGGGADQDVRGGDPAHPRCVRAAARRAGARVHRNR